MDYKLTPSVIPAANFDIQKDSEALRAAMKGLGTDEQAIIDILTVISNEQRQKLKEQYHTTFNRDLIKDLKSELGGKFEDVIKALMLPTNEYLCKQLHDALKYVSLNRPENVLIEILFTRSHHEIAQLVAGYKPMYDCSLEEDIHNRKLAESDFRSLFTQLLTSVREPAGTVDEAKAKQQAEQLIAVGKGEFNIKEEVFYRLFATASLAQLRLVFMKYNELAGHSVHEAVKRGTDKFPEIMLSLGEFKYLHLI